MGYKNLLYRIVSTLFLFLLLFIFVSKYIDYLSFVIYILYVLIFVEIILYFKKYNFIFFISLLYVFISLVSIKLYFDYFFILKIFLFTITIITLFDISSYIFGSLFGKLKMLPKISPNKTFVGFYAGLVITFAVSLILNYIFNLFNQKTAIFFIILIIVSSFLGDLFESVFKRNSNIKNSSNIIPGHGGLFDRFDSFLMSFNSLCLYSYFLEFNANN